MSISKAAQERISEEEGVLDRTLTSLQSSFASESAKFHRRAKEARSLTSQIVNSTRDIDKQMLANEESISHSLSGRAKEESDTIEELLESPYFARIVLEEDSGASKRIIEYKLGKKSHLDSGIIDWKNAPLAKLFYEYEEGEHYLEDIRDRERSGKILRKHKVKIVDSELSSFECAHGRFKKNKDGSWQETTKAKLSSEGKFELPSILSYITAEQFRLITEEASQAVILHGIAGSGKTSVALHRLTWQLAQEPSPNALVITPTEILAKYLKNTLEKLGVSGVSIYTSSTWIRKISLESGIPEHYKEKLKMLPPHLARVKLSLAFVKTLITKLDQYHSVSSHKTCEDIILATLSETTLFLDNDNSNLIDKKDIHEALGFTKENFLNSKYDYCDELLFLLIYKTKNFGSTLPSHSHLFLDEFQDSTPVELALASAFIKDKHKITITGDIAQHTIGSQLHQASMEALMITDTTRDSVHTLSVSHRSTLQIMRYADHIFGTQRTTDGRNGKPPLMILCDSQSSALKELISWIERVVKNFSGDPVLIITNSNSTSRDLHSLLKPAFDSAVSLLAEAPRSTDGLILIASLQECKGLEFPHVMLWDVSKTTYPPSSENRRKLYLAATRAEEHLALLVWDTPSNILPPLSSKLHRIYDTRDETAIEH